MATFTNQATLSYNGIVTNSNVTTGELVAVLSASKTAITDSYEAGQPIAYALNILNTGTTPINGVSVSDNLGSYVFNPTTNLVPLTYEADSVQYYLNGVLQAAPTVAAGPPLVISGLTIPAGGNALLLYAATPNQFAPLAAGASIVNTALITATGISEPVTVTETVSASTAPELTISKAICPTVVNENGELTYTFIIQNTGNTAVTAADLVTVTDTFDPALNPIDVTFNGTNWAPTTNYTYNSATGAFATVAGQITVPAATYTPDPTTGSYTVTPGVSTLVITGTV